MRRVADIQRRHGAQIADAARRFRDHEGMNYNRILQWVAQFENTELGLSTRVLESVRYYDARSIRAMCVRLVLLVRRHYRTLDFHRIVFVPVGNPGGGSGVIARALHDLTPRPRILTMIDLGRQQPATLGVIVFIDDFSGTGDTLVKWWESVESFVRPLGAPLAVALLVLNQRARPEIATFARHTFCAEELDGAANVLSPDTEAFTTVEREALVRYCLRTQCSPSLVRGYGECGLLIAFRHGCPNNSLPFLWHQSRQWRALFRRRAI